MSGAVVWLTGLPASGKSTAARLLVGLLRERDLPACLLDGDEVRAALVPRPGYSDRERDDFYATLSRLGALLAHQGLAVAVAATAHRRAHREDARRRAPRFFEVFVDPGRETCEARDPKGLYARAREGRITGLPGVDAPYEAPRDPELVLSGGRDVRGIERLAELVGETPPPSDR